MARVTGNSLLRGVSGKIGSLVIRQVGDQTIVSAAERLGPRAPRSPKQQAQLDRMYRAQLYAKAQMLDPDAKARYATGIDARRTSAYTVAVADYLNAPTITRVDLSGYRGRPGDALQIWATDDFAVTAVHVRILSTPDGPEVESGPALLQPDASWRYLVQRPHAPGAPLTLHLEAHDLPRNVGQLVQTLPAGF